MLTIIWNTNSSPKAIKEKAADKDQKYSTEIKEPALHVANPLFPGTRDGPLSIIRRDPWTESLNTEHEMSKKVVEEVEKKKATREKKSLKNEEKEEYTLQKS